MVNFCFKNTPAQVKFSELDPSAIFVEPRPAKDFYFMKLSENNFVNLSNGYCGFWSPDDLVIPIDENICDIFINKLNDRTYFSDIGYGETFTINDACYYMKVSAKNANAVNLITGKFCNFDPHQLIQITTIFYKV